MTEPRTYSGWKSGLAIVGATIVVFSLLNVLAKAVRHHPDPEAPTPAIVSVTPSRPS